MEVARDLLGQVVVHGSTAGRIVETEAYLGGDDLASHSAAGPTPRAAVMFGPPGHAYVYRIYGMHDCLNFVTEQDDVPGAVLIRALEPLEGIDLMRQRRGLEDLKQLCSGPGKLAQALAIDRTLNKVDVTKPGPLLVRAGAMLAESDIVVTTRVGITKCADWPLRFYERDSKFVSRK